MKDEAIYRCIHAACARALPRPVNFCPYCGTGQHAGVDKPAHRVTGAGVAPSSVAAAAPLNSARPAAAASTAAAAAVPGYPAGADSPTTPAQPSNASQAGAVAPPAPGSPARPRPTGAPHASVARGSAPTPTPTRANERQPVRLRWWLLALAVLWAIWLVARPTDKRIDARIEKAVALAIECKASEAQSELIALRSTRAKPQQLARLQQELNDAAAECKRVRQRSKAWSDARAAVQTALRSSAYDKARSRLSAFTRRWGEDEETRALKAQVEAAAPREHPLASPDGR